MDSSKKPRTGVGRAISAGIKNTRKKAQAKKSQTYRVPKGLNIPGLKGGAFTTVESWNALILPALEEKQQTEKKQKLQERRQKDAQNKKETRAHRAAQLSKADGENVSKKEMTDFKRKKGMHSDTAKLREKTRYRWYGVFKVQGSEAAVKKAAQAAGSDPRRVKPQQQADGSWSVMLARFFQHGTPKAALGDGENPGFIPGHVQQAITEFKAEGVSHVHYAGAVWQNMPSKKGEK